MSVVEVEIREAPRLTKDMEIAPATVNSEVDIATEDMAEDDSLLPETETSINEENSSVFSEPKYDIVDTPDHHNGNGVDTKVRDSVEDCVIETESNASIEDTMAKLEHALKKNFERFEEHDNHENGISKEPKGKALLREVWRGIACFGIFSLKGFSFFLNMIDKIKGFIVVYSGIVSI